MLNIPNVTCRKSRYGDMAAFPEPPYMKAAAVHIAFNPLRADRRMVRNRPRFHPVMCTHLAQDVRKKVRYLVRYPRRDVRTVRSQNLYADLAQDVRNRGSRSSATKAACSRCLGWRPNVFVAERSQDGPRSASASREIFG
jgi:hypothetical protein